MTIRRLLVDARLDLARNEDAAAAPRLEAELLLAHVLDVDRSHFFAHPDQDIDPEQSQQFLELVRRRADGEPLAYIVGEQEFWSLPLRVNADVLIPRPETELLVELSLERLPGSSARVADIGTGSGAIALALANERPDIQVFAVDVSAGALAVATTNAERLGLGNVTFALGSWCAPLDGHFDMIVSNPPYIREDDEHLDIGDLRFEPRVALTPGADEFEAFLAIADGATARLKPGGWLLFEHGYSQGPALRERLETRGWRDIETRKDLAGRDRVTFGKRPA